MLLDHHSRTIVGGREWWTAREWCLYKAGWRRVSSVLQEAQLLKKKGVSLLDEEVFGVSPSAPTPRLIGASRKINWDWLWVASWWLVADGSWRLSGGCWVLNADWRALSGDSWLSVDGCWPLAAGGWGRGLLGGD